MSAPFLPAGELLVPTAVATVAAGASQTLTLRAPDGGAMGLNRLVFAAADLSALTVAAVVGDRRVFGNVHAALFNALYDTRQMRAPLVVPEGQTFELTVTNGGDTDERVTVLAEAYNAAQLDAWRTFRQAAGLPERETLFLWNEDDVLAAQERRRVDVPTRSGGCVVTRVLVGAHKPGLAQDDTPGLSLALMAQGREIVQTTTPGLLARAYAGREMLPGIRLGMADSLSLFLTSALPATTHVTVLAEAFR